MGCCSSRSEEEDPNEKIIIQVEEKLNLSKLNSSFIDRIIHRFSNNLKIDHNHLGEIKKSLKLEDNSHFIKFIDYFFLPSDYMYCAKKLSCLGILLGLGPTKEKAKLLFQNYDEDSSKSICENELKEMLTDVVYISFDYLIDFTYYNFANQDTFRDYKISLYSSINTIINHYTRSILEDKKEIDENNFISCFNRAEMICLLTPRKLRTYSLKLLKNAKLIARNVNRIMSSPELKKEDFYKRISQENIFSKYNN